MSKEQLKELIYTHASDCARKGGGWSQESVVLREVSDRVTKENGKDIVLQRMIRSEGVSSFIQARMASQFSRRDQISAKLQPSSSNASF